MQCCILGIRDVDTRSECSIRTAVPVGGDEDVLVRTGGPGRDCWRDSDWVSGVEGPLSGPGLGINGTAHASTAKHPDVCRRGPSAQLTSWRLREPLDITGP